MSKNKIYLPANESYDEFLILSTSKEGIIIPLNFLGHPHLHATVYAKKIQEKDQTFKVSIHITDIIRNEIIKEFYFEFNETELKEFVQKLLDIIKELSITEETLDKSTLCCFDCGLTDINMQKAMKNTANAKEFWKKFHQDINIQIIPVDKCTDIKHKLILDVKNERVYTKSSPGCYLVIDEEYSFIERLKPLVEEYFGEEFRAIDNIMAQINTAITNHNNKYHITVKNQSQIIEDQTENK